MQGCAKIDDFDACSHELAGLVQLFLLADKQKSSIPEAERSIWRTAGDIERDSAITWLKVHSLWGSSLTELYESRSLWPPLGRKPKAGDLASPKREDLPSLQVVLKSDEEKVYFAEPGDAERVPQYLKNFVACAEMPHLSES